jgi:hypothetical protein
MADAYGIGGFAGGLSQGINQGISIATAYEAGKLRKQQAGLDQFKTLLQIMELPSATRQVVSQGYLKTMGIAPESAEGKSFLTYLQKAQESDRQELMSLAEVFGLENIDENAMQSLVKNPSALTALMKQRDTKRQEDQAAMLLGIETPGQQPDTMQAGGEGDVPQLASLGGIEGEALPPQPGGGGTEGYNTELGKKVLLGKQSTTPQQAVDVTDTLEGNKPLPPEAGLKPASGPVQPVAQGSFYSPPDAEQTSARQQQILDLRKRRDLALVWGRDDIAKVLDERLEALGDNPDPSKRYKLFSTKAGLVMVDTQPENGGPPQPVKTPWTVMPGQNTGAGSGSGSGKMTSPFGKLIADSEAIKTKYGPDSPEYAAIQAKIAKEASKAGGMTVRALPGGGFEVVMGGGGESGLQTGSAADRQREHQANLQGAIDITRKLLDMAETRPELFGTSGALLKTGQELSEFGLEIGQVFSSVFGADVSTVDQALRRAIDWGLPGDQAAEMFNPSLSEIEILENSLRVMYARTLNPKGQLLAGNLAAAKGLIKLQGWFTSGNSAKARLKQLLDLFEGDKKRSGVLTGDEVQFPGAETEEEEAPETPLGEDPNATFDDLFGGAE